jgi:hypothetical protein
MDTKKNQENREKGISAEKGFAKFLDDNGIPFYHIDQNKDEYFSEELHKKRSQRPDFIVHTKVGLFHIDVKFRVKIRFGATGEVRFPLDQDIIKKLFNLEAELRSQVWIAFTENRENFIFYYVPILAINQYYKDICKTYAETYSEEYDKKKLLFIPNDLLYDNFSFEKGFFRHLDAYSIENEIQYYRIRANKG